MNYTKVKKSLVNKKIVFLDLWGTVFIENNIYNLNFKRAEVLNSILDNKYEINYLKDKIEKNITSFKVQEKAGKSISSTKRIENVLKSIDLEFDTNLIDKIVYAFDKLYFDSFKPIINKKLLDLVSSKKTILVSNTGLVTGNCIDRLLDYYNIKNNFLKRYYSDQLLYCKPNPMFLKKVIKENNLTVNDCIYIGDSYEMDYQLCLKLGVDCVIDKWEI